MTTEELKRYWPVPGCLGCIHWETDRAPFCAAYPKGVPLEIASGMVDHVGPRTGDHGVRFEPKPDAKPGV